ncbi:MAG: two-component sensor histidine kinase [Crocinitomicaceae bacterium]|jgi:two-component sensor histidine kinase
MTEKNTISRYVFRGVLIGLLFPVLAMIICWFVLTPEGSSYSLMDLHESFPLLWIIDSAPIVLGVISYVVGSHVRNSDQNFNKQIEEINYNLQLKNDQLEELVTEKEVLLKEVHHRVKNNLQIITSLLSLQASFMDSERIKALFRYSQYRINSMAMIHEMLYRSDDISRIDFGEYADKLISGIISSMKGSQHYVTSKIDVPYQLNIDTAIPLGLLINEIVTNSLKYGIRGDNPGTIILKIKKQQHSDYRMIISDDGVGFSSDINFRDSTTLGLMLIHKLSIQLQGSIEKDNSKKGTEYIINFQEITQIS